MLKHVALICQAGPRQASLGQDDRLDVLAIAVTFWMEAMARDNEQASKEHIDDLREAEMEAFMEQAGGAPSGGLSWMQYN